MRTQPWEAEKLMCVAAPGGRAAARVGVSEVVASVSRLAAALVGGAAALCASLSFKGILGLGTQGVRLGVDFITRIDRIQGPGG